MDFFLKNRVRIAAFFLFALGSFRCFFDFFSTSTYQSYLEWLAPRPAVFSAEQYRKKKKLVIEMANNELREYNYRSRSSWPLKIEPLIFQNSLVHAIDRPQLVPHGIWKKTIEYHFCGRNPHSSVKEEILTIGVRRLAFYLDEEGGERLVRELECSI